MAGWTFMVLRERCSASEGWLSRSRAPLTAPAATASRQTCIVVLILSGVSYFARRCGAPPNGAVLMMRRARPMTEGDFRQHVLAGLYWAWDYRGPDDDDTPFEPQAKDWGWLDDRPVAVDYANTSENLPTV